MNYDELTPGRELDAKVAEKVMGWIREDGHEGEIGWIHPPYDDKRIHWAAEWDNAGLPNWLPKFSTESAAAWEVVEKLRDDGFIVTIEGDDDRVGVTITEIGGGDIGTCWIAERNRDAEAICIAALKATETQP